MDHAHEPANAVSRGACRWLVVGVVVCAAVASAHAQPMPSDAGAPAAPVADAGVPAPDAQPGSPAAPAGRSSVVNGRVLARGTREPLAGAVVTAGENAATETDGEGRFTLALRPGRHHVVVQQAGYAPLDKIIDVPTADVGGLPEQTFRLDPRTRGERYETVVAADPQAPRLTLRQDELTRTPGSFGDPLRVIESLPGVSQVVWPLALYAIRGANPGNTGFFVDGVRLPALYHFALGPSVIHPFFIEQVDFYPGGYPARYGRYVAGVVTAKAAAPKVDRTRVSADVRLFDAGGIVVTPINHNKGTIALAGRVSYTGLLFSLFSPDYTFNYWDYQARFEHPLGPGRLTIFAFGAGDRLGRKEMAADDAALDFHRLDLRWSALLGGGRFTVSTTGGYDSSATSIKSLVSLPISVRTRSVAGRVGYSHGLGKMAAVEVGGDVELQRFAPQSSLTVAAQQSLFRARTVVPGGVFAALTLGTGTRFEVTPALRYDVFTESGTVDGGWGPRLSLRYRLAERTYLKAAGGRFLQTASLPVAVPGFEGFGLKEFGLQWSWQGSTGIEAPIGNFLDLDATGFLQRFQLTDLQSQFNYDPQLPILEKRDGRAYGFELLLRRPVRERFYGWISYTLSKSERVVGALLARAPSDWDQRHILNLVTGYRFNGGISAGARIHYNTGRPYPVFDARTSSTDYIRLPAFYQLDLRVDKRWVFDAWVLDGYIELVNTTLTREVYDIKRASDGTLDQYSFRIVLPSIGVHAEW